MDIAASIQRTTEKVMMKMANHAHQVTGCDSLCLAGGVALNCVSNGKIMRQGPFKNIWVQPAAGDAGGALGAALLTWHQLLDMPRKVKATDSQKGSYLGPQFSDEAIQNLLDSKGLNYMKADSEAHLCKEVARLLASENVIGWFQGRMEFGPRALGGRSILGDARSHEMQKTMNLKIKFRESFRPFAPSVLREKAAENFQLPNNAESPYMLLVTEVNEEIKQGDANQLDDAVGLKKLKIERSKLQAITHVDHSARVQTVDKHRNPLYHLLINEFEAITGCPVIINTSFNVRGEPIVCTPEEALKVFLYTHMDVLVLGKIILLKKDQPDVEKVDAERHLAKFELD
jgi:carbamoyltransferase